MEHYFILGKQFIFDNSYLSDFSCDHMKKNIFNALIIVMIFIAASGSKVTANDIVVSNTITFTEEQEIPYFENVVLITWDGTNAEWFSKLVNNGTLVNCQRVLENGFEQLVRVTTQSVSTNPCLSTMETGYSQDIHGVTRNVFGAGSEKLAIPDKPTPVKHHANATRNINSID